MPGICLPAYVYQNDWRDRANSTAITWTACLNFLTDVVLVQYYASLYGLTATTTHDSISITHRHIFADFQSQSKDRTELGSPSPPSPEQPTDVLISAPNLATTILTLCKVCQSEHDDVDNIEGSSDGSIETDRAARLASERANLSASDHPTAAEPPVLQPVKSGASSSLIPDDGSGFSTLPTEPQHGSSQGNNVGGSLVLTAHQPPISQASADRPTSVKHADTGEEFEGSGRGTAREQNVHTEPPVIHPMYHTPPKLCSDGAAPTTTFTSLHHFNLGDSAKFLDQRDRDQPPCPAVLPKLRPQYIQQSALWMPPKGTIRFLIIFRRPRMHNLFLMTLSLRPPMIDAPAPCRYPQRISDVLVLGSLSHYTLSSGAGSSSFSYSGDSGQTPNGTGSYTSGAGDTESSHDPYFEMLALGHLGPEGVVDVQAISGLPSYGPDTATSPSYDFFGLPALEFIHPSPIPSPPPSLSLPDQPHDFDPRYGDGYGISLHEYSGYAQTIPGPTDPMGSQSLPIQAPPGPDTYYRAEARSYPPVQLTNAAHIDAFQGDVTPSLDPHATGPFGLNAASNIELGTYFPIPGTSIHEQPRFPFNLPHQLDFAAPNQSSYSRDFINGFRAAVALLTTPQANPSFAPPGSSVSYGGGVGLPSSLLASISWFNQAGTVPPTVGPPAIASGLSQQVGLQSYAPPNSAYPPAYTDPGPSSRTPGAGTGPTVDPQAPHQWVESDIQNIGHAHNPGTSHAAQPVAPAGVAPSPTPQAPVSAPTPAYSTTDASLSTPGTTPGSQGGTDKTYRCQECTKSYRRPGELKDHIAFRHGGERRHECPIEGCKRTYANRSNRTKHLREHHGSGTGGH